MKHYTALQYAKALNELVTAAPAESEKVVSQFVRTLSKNGDASLASDIVHHFEKIIHKESNTLKAELTLPVKKSVEFPKEIHHTKIKSELTYDDKITGGIKIQIGDVVIDNTINERIKRLKAVIG